MLKLVPVSFKDACSLVDAEHRHNRAPQGHKFSVGLDRDGELVGAVMVGRPVARSLDDGFTLEVTRNVVKPDIKNGCSMLYGAAWRATQALGYTRLITYTQANESGSSPKAAGFTKTGELKPRPGWNSKSRKRDSEYLSTARIRWEKTCS